MPEQDLHHDNSRKLPPTRASVPQAKPTRPPASGHDAASVQLLTLFACCVVVGDDDALPHSVLDLHSTPMAPISLPPTPSTRHHLDDASPPTGCLTCSLHPSHIRAVVHAWCALAPFLSQLKMKTFTVPPDLPGPLKPRGLSVARQFACRPRLSFTALQTAGIVVMGQLIASQ